MAIRDYCEHGSNDVSSGEILSQTIESTPSKHQLFATTAPTHFKHYFRAARACHFSGDLHFGWVIIEHFPKIGVNLLTTREAANHQL